MIRINLLPHREEAKKERRQQFFVLAGLVSALGLLIVFAGYSLISGYISNQESANEFLKKEIAVLDKQLDQIKRLKEQTQALLARKQVIENLQRDRGETIGDFALARGVGTFHETRPGSLRNAEHRGVRSHRIAGSIGIGSRNDGRIRTIGLDPRWVGHQRCRATGFRGGREERERGFRRSPRAFRGDFYLPVRVSAVTDKNLRTPCVCRYCLTVKRVGVTSPL